METGPSQIAEVSSSLVSQPAIVYLSCVPTGMTVAMVQQIFEKFGTINKIFLKPRTEGKRLPKKYREYEEGWIEFAEEKRAKKATRNLNNTLVEGKKNKKWSGQLWCCKLLQTTWNEITLQNRENKAMELGSKKRSLKAALRAKRQFKQMVLNSRISGEQFKSSQAPSKLSKPKKSETISAVSKDTVTKLLF